MHNSLQADCFYIESVANNAITINEVARLLTTSESEIVKLVYDNLGVIPAIKLVRVFTGQGLKASKLYVDAKYRNKTSWLFIRS